MTQQATVDNRIDPSHSGENPTAGGDAGAIKVDSDLLSFIHEAQRLFEEAEARLRSGAVLPALSSLAAVLPLHGMLMGRCSEMLEQPGDDSPELTNGLYL